MKKNSIWFMGKVSFNFFANKKTFEAAHSIGSKGTTQLIKYDTTRLQ